MAENWNQIDEANFHPTARAFRSDLERTLDKLKKQGLGREAVVILASHLQHELAADREKLHPLSDDLEHIMRAVLAVLQGGIEFGHHQDYLIGKLKYGSSLLQSSLAGRRMASLTDQIV